MRAVVIVALLLVIAYIAGGLLNPTPVYISQREVVKYDNVTTASIVVPAVDAEGRGVASEITVQVMPGSGMVLANIDKLLFWIDTQHSIQVARTVAHNMTGIDLSGLDLAYTISANASLVEGPSAGAALAVVTVAALQNRSINRSVMLTGTIEPDGTIGMVGGIREKVGVAKRLGSTLFLVPVGGLAEISAWTREWKCQQVNHMRWCEIDYRPVATDMGIEIREISNISQALQYILI